MIPPPPLPISSAAKAKNISTHPASKHDFICILVAYQRELFVEQTPPRRRLPRTKIVFPFVKHVSFFAPLSHPHPAYLPSKGKVLFFLQKTASRIQNFLIFVEGEFRRFFSREYLKWIFIYLS